MSDYSYFCGIDLAKNHFSLHAEKQNGKVILHKSVTRSKLLTTIANMPLMRIGVEACGGAHYWARTLNQRGHDASISPKTQSLLAIKVRPIHGEFRNEPIHLAERHR
ncbi:transposase [Vibrio tasmaniensis]|nr:transposase [Vibrio tasmaniensis]